jgi:predicted amidophosphoribosyltransferase
MIVAVSGIRDLSEASIADVELAAIEEATEVDEMRFGGAAGVDTAALAAICDAPIYKTVIVPYRLRDQPHNATQVAKDCADHIIEMRLPRSRTAPLRRNDLLLDGADRLLAFTDGRETGGTYYTIQEATERGLDVVVVPVVSLEEVAVETDRFTTGLAGFETGFSAPVYSYMRYFGERHGDPTSDLIRRMKAGAAGELEVRSLAMDLARYAQRDMPSFDAIVAMPRRRPGATDQLEQLAGELAARLGVRYLPQHLVRLEEPKGGNVVAYRVRNDAAEHFRTMRFCPPRAPRVQRVCILDNVVTLGGTMEGAIQRVRHDSGSEIVGLAVLHGMRA